MTKFGRRVAVHPFACHSAVAAYSGAVKSKWLLPTLFLVVFAVSRIPGLLPPSFSAAYALAFCAGVYFPGRMAWWLPLGALAVTDLGLNLYYLFALDIPVFKGDKLLYLVVNYAGYVLLILLGRRFSAKSSFLSLLGGGLLGALSFYLITNTASWLFNPFGNPEYTNKSLWSWLLALTKGVSNWPSTWEFFRNTLSSGGLFTGLFVGAMKLSEAAESTEEKEEESEEEAEPESKPEDAKA